MRDATGRLRLDFPHEGPIHAEQRVGRFRVQVITYLGELCHRALAQDTDGRWLQVRSFTDTDERNYPKQAARIGHAMAEAVRQGQPTQTGSLAL